MSTETHCQQRSTARLFAPARLSKSSAVEEALNILDCCHPKPIRLGDVLQFPPDTSSRVLAVSHCQPLQIYSQTIRHHRTEPSLQFRDRKPGARQPQSPIAGATQTLRHLILESSDHRDQTDSLCYSAIRNRIRPAKNHLNARLMMCRPRHPSNTSGRL